MSTVSAVINVTPSLDLDPSPTGYVAVLDWNPIVEGEAYAHTQALMASDVLAGPVTVVLQNAPLSNGPLYIRVYAVAGAVNGPLSNEVVFNYDFRPGAPSIALV